MNGRALIYGSLAAFAAAQASALAIDNLSTRAVIQAAIGLLMFVAGVFVHPPTRKPPEGGMSGT